MAGEERHLGSSDFGTLLRRYRLEAGLSQEVLAERAHLSVNGVGALERGYRRAPHRETLSLLAGALALDDERRRAFEAAATRAKSPRRGIAAATHGLLHDRGLAGLPFALTSFVGRQTELDAIAALVRAHRLVTLTGAGGIGKTQAALRAVALLGPECPDDVCFVGLAPVTEPALVVSAIAAAAAVQELPERPLLQTLAASLRARPTLLLLDNCEHLVGEAARAVEYLLSNCATLHILATSREPLRCPGERNYRLPPLTPDDALALFLDRARAADHRFTVNDDNAAVVAEICSRLDGIPLAIELAAARVNVLSVKMLNERLNNHVEALGGGERTASPRRQTMAAAIDWSYNLLSAQEQRLFERLSVFAGGCTLELATLVCVDQDMSDTLVLDLLVSLVDKSLLVADVDRLEPRYSLLEPFRQYARERLARRHDVSNILHRHAMAFLALAKRLDGEYDADSDRVRDAMREELGNWRAVLFWTLTERGDARLGQQLAASLWVLWKLIPAEGRRWLSAAQDVADGTTPARVRAALRLAEAEVAGTLRAYEMQLEAAEGALSDFRALGDAAGMAAAQSLQCAVLINLRRLEQAKALLPKTLALAKAAGNQHSLAYAYRCLAFVIGPERRAARRYLVKALRLYEAANDRSLAASTLVELGGFETNTDPELGLTHMADALAIVREMDDKAKVATYVMELAFNLIELGRYDEAEGYAKEALDLARRQRLAFSVAVSMDMCVAVGILRADRAQPAREAFADAARALGFCDARLGQLGSARNPWNQALYDKILGAIGAAIESDALTRLMAEGAGMSEEEAARAALAAMGAAPSSAQI